MQPLPTNRQLSALHRAAINVLSLCEKCAPGPWGVIEPDAKADGNGFSGRLSIIAPGGWRRRPTAKKGEPWKELCDIALVCGGLDETARAHAHLLAMAREVLPRFAGAVMQFAQILAGNGLFEHGDEPDSELNWKPEETGRASESHALQRFWQEIADAIDNLLEAAGGPLMGLALSNRNSDAMERLLQGGPKARLQRAELLQAVLSMVDPLEDEERLKRLPPSSRVKPNGLPRTKDFYEAIPDLVRHGLRGVPPQTDAELERELIAGVLGKSLDHTLTDGEIERGRQLLTERLREARAALPAQLAAMKAAHPERYI